MSAQAMNPAHDGPDPRAYHLAEGEDHDHAHGDGATQLGFWIYLMSDALIFAALFAVFGVVGTSYAGGPTPHEAFELPLVALNTALLLISSITFGMGMIAMEEGKKGMTQLWLVITFLFGAGFVAVELHEFAGLIAEGATPQRSAFLSAFFTLVGTHGLHVSFGLLWILVMLVQVAIYGIGAENKRRLMCLSMFWHFLDIIWIGVFTFIYLFGVIR
ncbi:cytochrome o ubiquinol oxidase subunit III [Roseomonas elaeocarpi]|uniref:Cytochrome bo(3) ubiquinol oxidase subunit 3 n=1 Tax=Roseomonas elaeocarpi TaxID=907779 RepID=A0ABV6JQU8_9PROT